MPITLTSIVSGAVAHGGEHPLFLRTLRALLPRLESRAQRLAPSDPDLRDDILAAGARAVANALIQFDARRGVPLEAFATECAYQRMSDEARKARTKQMRSTDRVTLGEPNAAGADISTLPDESVDPLLALVQEETRIAIERAIEKLPERGAAVARALLAGSSQAEVARDFGVSRMAVSKWVAKLRADFRRDLKPVVYSLAA